MQDSRNSNSAFALISAKHITLLLILIFFSAAIIGFMPKSVRATGIASRNNPQVIDFVPNGEFETNWRVSSQGKDVNISVSGPMAKYAEISKGIIKVTDEDKTFKVTFRFPEKADFPGKLAHSINVEEITGDSKHSIGTAINVRWSIYIRVPYEGPYVETELTAGNIDINQTSNFLLKIYNRGTVPMAGITPRLDLYDVKKNRLKTIYLREANIESKGSYNDEYAFDSTGYNTGEYALISTVDWPGQNSSTSKFIIGTQSVQIQNFKKNLTAGKIDKFIIEVFNDWDKVINSVYAEISIDNQKYKSTPATMGPWTLSVLEGYIDARDFSPGEKKAILKVYYDGKVMTREITLTILPKENIKIVPEKQTPGPVEPASGQVSSDMFSVNNILVGAVVMLLLITMIMVMKMSKFENMISRQIDRVDSPSSGTIVMQVPMQMPQYGMQPSQYSGSVQQLPQLSGSTQQINTQQISQQSGGVQQMPQYGIPQQVQFIQTPQGQLIQVLPQGAIMQQIPGQQIMPQQIPQTMHSQKKSKKQKKVSTKQPALVNQPIPTAQNNSLPVTAPAIKPSPTASTVQFSTTSSAQSVSSQPTAAAIVKPAQLQPKPKTGFFGFLKKKEKSKEQMAQPVAPALQTQQSQSTLTPSIQQSSIKPTLIPSIQQSSTQPTLIPPIQQSPTQPTSQAQSAQTRSAAMHSVTPAGRKASKKKISKRGV